MALKPASTFIPSRAAIVDKDGMATFAFLKILQDWDTKLRNGLNQIGQLIGEINAATKIEGRTEGIGTTVQHVDSTGIVLPPGLSPATDTEHGAVILPVGASSTILGTAAIEPTSAFDVSGAAAAAQTAAETFAASAAAAAQSNAESFASNASNLLSGTVPIARMPGLAGSITIATAKLTVGGANGSMTFQNGVLTAQVAAT